MNSTSLCSHKWTYEKSGGSCFFDQDQMRFYALRLQPSHTARFYARWIFDSSSLRRRVKPQEPAALFYRSRLRVISQRALLERVSSFVVAGPRNDRHVDGLSNIFLTPPPHSHFVADIRIVIRCGITFFSPSHKDVGFLVALLLVLVDESSRDV